MTSGQPKRSGIGTQPGPDANLVVSVPQISPIVNRVLAWSAVAGLVLFSALALDVALNHRTSPFPIDAAVNDWISTNRVGWLVAVSQFLARIGAGVIGDLIVPGVIIILFVLARRWRQAVVFATALIVSGLLVQLVKDLVHRARPPHGLVLETSWSFPSGHAAHAATLVVLLMLALRWWWVGVAGTVYAVAMAASRVYLGVHWLTDVAAGLLFGACVAILVTVAVGWLLARIVPLAAEG
jgi:membrane-associated phospholipid phosphatase